MIQQIFPGLFFKGPKWVHTPQCLKMRAANDTNFEGGRRFVSAFR